MRYLTSITVIILFVGISDIHAQGNTVTTEELSEFGRQLDRGVVRLVKSKRVKGSPYLNDEWLKGYVMVTDKANTEMLRLRFNTETNTLEFLRNETVYALDSRKIKGFVIPGHPSDLVFKNGFNTEDDDINRSTFLRIISDGKTKFVCHHETSLKEDLSTYGMASQIDEYVSTTDYYVITPDGKLHDIKLKRKDIVRTLSDEEDKVKEFVRANNLDYGEEDDVKRIVSFYNNLKAGSN